MKEYGLEEKELEEFNAVISGVLIPELIRIADKYNYTRDSMIKFAADTLTAMSEVATFEHYKAALSSSENPNKWIPVETALPEEAESVLVYAERNAYDDKGQFRKKVIDIGWQVDGGWHIDGCNGVVGIAWMSLPKPYSYEESEVSNE